MCFQEELPRFLVGSHTLEERQNIARLVRSLGIKVRWRELWIDSHYFLEESGHGTDRVPDEGRQLGKVLAALAQLDQSIVPFVGILEFVYVFNNRELLLVTEECVGHEVALAHPIHWLLYGDLLDDVLGVGGVLHII